MVMKKLAYIGCILLSLQYIAAAKDNGDEGRPYEFGFTIDGQQHRHESKDANGIIQGEFGFITGDGVYHTTVYATDANGAFKILSMRSVKISPPLDQLPDGKLVSYNPSKSSQPSSTHPPAQPNPTERVRKADVPIPSTTAKAPFIFTTQPTLKPACGGCGVPRPSTKKPEGLDFQNPHFQKTPQGPSNQNNQQLPGPIQNRNSIEEVNTQKAIQNHIQSSVVQHQDNKNNYNPLSDLQPPAYNPEKQQHTHQENSNGKPVIAPVGEFPSISIGPVGNKQTQSSSSSSGNVNSNQQNIDAYNHNNKQESPNNKYSSIPPQLNSNNLNPASPSNFNSNNRHTSNGQQSSLPNSPSGFNNNQPNQHSSLPNANQISSQPSPNDHPSHLPGGQLSSPNNKPSLPSTHQQSLPSAQPSLPNGQPPLPNNPSVGHSSLSQPNNNPSLPASISSDILSLPPNPSSSLPTLLSIQNNVVPSKDHGVLPVRDVNANTPADNLNGITVTDNQINIPNNPPIPIVDKYPGMEPGLPEGVEEKNVLDLLYKFNYTVGFHGHYEKGLKNGAKVGGYFVNGRDGFSRVVTYVADENGYRPKFKLINLGLDSPDTPKEETEKTFGLKNFEFVWYPVH